MDLIRKKVRTVIDLKIYKCLYLNMPELSDKLQEKRYVISKEENARKKFEVFREIFWRVEKEHPEIIGATLFGSMVKGTAGLNSDIDAFIFVDLDKIKNTITPQEVEVANAQIAKLKNEHDQKVAEGKEFGEYQPTPVEDYIVTHRYKELFTEPLKSTGLTDEQMRDVRIMAVSKNDLEDELEKAVDSQQKVIEYDQKQKELYQQAIDSENWDQYYDWKKENQVPDEYFMNWKVSAMFHLAMGRGIQTYREIVANFLQQKGKVGEVVWRSGVISRTADMERNFRGSSYQNLFPQTLDDARKYYHLKKAV